jgi:hypothetical protein
MVESPCTLFLLQLSEWVPCAVDSARLLNNTLPEREVTLNVRGGGEGREGREGGGGG